MSSRTLTDDAVDVCLLPLSGMPLVREGDDLAALISVAAEACGVGLRDGDVVAVAQKVVSKAEGRLVDLSTVEVTEAARSLADRVAKPPELVQVVLDESRAVLRAAPGVLVVETRHGFVCANAGVDHSNVGHAAGIVALLPQDPDASARRLRDGLATLTGARVAVLVNDSHGRAWRQGTVGVAIGAAGIEALADYRGRFDLFGRPLQATLVGTIDELAAAASLVMGQADEGVPAVIVRGFRFGATESAAVSVQRPREADLFR